MIIESLMNARGDVPLPEIEGEVGGPSVRISLQTELKIRLHQAMLGTGLTRADLMRRLEWQRESVDRLFRLDHNSRIEQLEQAFAAIEMAVDIDIKSAA